jgi:hypothetical protein
VLSGKWFDTGVELYHLRTRTEVVDLAVRPPAGRSTTCEEAVVLEGSHATLERATDADTHNWDSSPQDTTLFLAGPCLQASPAV